MVVCGLINDKSLRSTAWVIVNWVRHLDDYWFLVWYVSIDVYGSCPMGSGITWYRSEKVWNALGNLFSCRTFVKKRLTAILVRDIAQGLAMVVCFGNNWIWYGFLIKDAELINILLGIVGNIWTVSFYIVSVKAINWLGNPLLFCEHVWVDFLIKSHDKICRGFDNSIAVSDVKFNA